jgi:polyphosphate kinase
VVLSVYLADTVKAREMLRDGSYQRVEPAPGAAPLDSQAWFIASRSASSRSIDWAAEHN